MVVGNWVKTIQEQFTKQMEKTQEYYVCILLFIITIIAYLHVTTGKIENIVIAMKILVNQKIT